MTSIATTTNTTPFQYPANTLLDRDRSSGYLYCLVKSSTANTYTMYRSTNNGSSWASFAATTRSNVQELGSIFLGKIGYLHWFYRTNESNQDRIYVRGLHIASATWVDELLLAAPGNGGVAGAVHTGVDGLSIMGSNGTEYFAIVAGTVSGSTRGITLYAAYTRPNELSVADNTVFHGTRVYLLESSTGRITPSVDIEHNGDGKTAGSPHLRVVFGRSDLRTMKCGWNGDGWNTPTQATLVASSIGTRDFIAGRWDGNRFLMAVPNGSTVNLWERNKANTDSTLRTSPTHTAGAVRACSVSYNTVTGDARVYAVATSDNDLYYVDYVRATGLWGGWAKVLATDILGSNVDNWGVRRSSYGNSKLDVYTAHSGSPNDLQHTSQGLSYTPSAPTWLTPQDGAAADVAVTLGLTWQHNDPDPADAQSAYALSRQIGTDAIEYWQASTGTWQSTEQINSSGTSAVTLPTGFVERFDAGVAAWTPTNGTFVAASTPARSGATSGLLTVTGSPSTSYTRAQVAVSASTSYTLSLWAYSTPGYSNVGASIDWYTSGMVYISTTSGPGTSLAAATWANRSVTGTSPANAAFAQFGPTLAGSPPTSTALYVDDVVFGATMTPWGASTDSPHVYRVKTRDTAANDSPYSAGLVVVPSAKVNPTISSPAHSSTVTSDKVTVTWTVAEQSAYRVRLVIFGDTLHDSQWVSGTATSYQVPTTLADGFSYSVFLSTKNLKGLASAEDQNDFTVDFVEPATGYPTPVAQTSNGIISVPITNPTPAGLQPAVSSVELWRREFVNPVLNSNPYFETDLSGWITATGGTAVRDNAQAHQGTWAYKMTPNGSANAFVESAKYAVTAGVSYHADGWVYATLTSKPTSVFIRWYTSGDVFISDTIAAVTPVAAGVWAYRSSIATAPPTAAKAAVCAGVHSTPAAGNTIWADEVRLRATDSSDGIRVGASLPSGSTVSDWRARHGVNYEYRVITQGANGTTSFGPWVG